MGCVGGDADWWGGSVSGAGRVTVRWGEADRWGRDVSERGRRGLGGLGQKRAWLVFF